MTGRSRPTLDWLGRVAVVGLAVVVDLVIWDADRRLRSGGLLPFPVMPVVTVLVHLTLLLRWRRPRSAFALQWVFAVVSSLALPDFQPFAGLLIALHAVASRLPPRESVPWLAGVLVPFGTQSWSTAVEARGSATRSFVLLLLLWALVALAVWGVGRVSYASAQRAWRLRELQTAEAAEAVTAERRRLAHELHDTVSHAVTGMLLQAAGAQTLLRPTDERLRGSLALIESTGVQAMAELHRLLGLLHTVAPAAHEEAVPAGPTVADISALVELARVAGRDVDLVRDGTPGELDPSVATAAYRVVQEGLTNSAKHSGPAAAVVVRLRWTPHQLEISVTDRRRGPSLPADRVAELSSGRGLAGLRERVLLVGGALDSATADSGFMLRARLPRPPERGVTAVGVGP